MRAISLMGLEWFHDVYVGIIWCGSSIERKSHDCFGHRTADRSTTLQTSGRIGKPPRSATFGGQQHSFDFALLVRGEHPRMAFANYGHVIRIEADPHKDLVALLVVEKATIAQPSVEAVRVVER